MFDDIGLIISHFTSLYGTHFVPYPDTKSCFSTVRREHRNLHKIRLAIELNYISTGTTLPFIWLREEVWDEQKKYIYNINVSTTLVIVRCTCWTYKLGLNRVNVTVTFLSWYCAATTHVFSFTDLLVEFFSCSGGWKLRFKVKLLWQLRSDWILPLGLATIERQSVNSFQRLLEFSCCWFCFFSSLTRENGREGNCHKFVAMNTIIDLLPVVANQLQTIARSYIWECFIHSKQESIT
jgi:hypothetical protein